MERLVPDSTYGLLFQLFMNRIQTIELNLPVPVLTLTITGPTVHHLLSEMITFVILVILDLVL